MTAIPGWQERKALKQAQMDLAETRRVVKFWQDKLAEAEAEVKRTRNKLESMALAEGRGIR